MRVKMYHMIFANNVLQYYGLNYLWCNTQLYVYRALHIAASLPLTSCILYGLHTKL